MFCSSCFHSSPDRRKRYEKRTIGDKEDYERTIKYYLGDGGVLRYNNVSCNTKCYKEPGGIQATRKKEDSRRNAHYLMNKYPDLVKINNNRNSGFVEIRLRDSNNIKRISTSKRITNSKKKILRKIGKKTTLKHK